MVDLVLSLALTLHLDNSGRDYNEVHPHVRLEKDSYAVGLFINSASNPVAYVSKTIGDETFLEFGLMDGYQDRTLPYGRVGHELSDNVTLFATPSIVDGKVGGIVLGVELSIGGS